MITKSIAAFTSRHPVLFTPYWFLKRAILNNTLSRRTRSRVRRLGVPVVAVTGTNGKTTIVRFVDHILRTAGYGVGLSCTRGVSRNGTWVACGDLAGPAGLARAACDSGVDVLVAETARGGILRSGFGFDACRVAVVTNIADDHLGVWGVQTLDQMARVKERLVERVMPSGVAVLNADDPRVAAMARRVRGSVIFFSSKRLPTHVREGVYVHDGTIVRRRAGVDEPFMPADAVAVSRRGLLPYNVQNVLAVIGVLTALDSVLPVTDEIVVEALKNWGDTPDGQFFGYHLLEYEGLHVLISHSKNPLGYATDVATLARLRSAFGYTAIVGLITHVGDRSACFLRTVGELSAEYCDRLMVVLPKGGFLRYRSPESLIAALEDGIPPEKRLAGIDGDCATIISRIRDDYPKNTLFVVFQAAIQRGAGEILKQGRPVDLGSV